MIPSQYNCGPDATQQELFALTDVPEHLLDSWLVTDSSQVRARTGELRRLTFDGAEIILTMTDATGEHRQARYDQDGKKVWEKERQKST
jgi:hypothetical protein